MVTTLLKVRAPGMSYMHMPIFCWTSPASNLLIVAAFPILTGTLALLLWRRALQGADDCAALSFPAGTPASET
jgi:cytochrome o ubiquinol oxidase subunit 1